MQPTVSDTFEAFFGLLMLGSAGLWIGILRRLWRRQVVIPDEQHSVVPWAGSDVIFLVFVAIGLEAAALRGFMENGKVPEQLSISAAAIQSVAHLVWIAFAAAFLMLKVGAYWDDLGIAARKLVGDLRLGGVTFLAVLLPVYGLQFLLTQFMKSEHPLAKLAMEQPSTGVLMLTTVSAVVVAPLFEEFMFRVLLQGWFEKWETLWRESAGKNIPGRTGLLPNVIVSALFGLSHLGHGPDPVALFVLSLILGYTYQRTHRIIAPLVVHVCFNARAVLMLWIMLW